MRFDQGAKRQEENPFNWWVLKLGFALIIGFGDIKGGKNAASSRSWEAPMAGKFRRSG
jgi:hypothetical protein